MIDTVNISKELYDVLCVVKSKGDKYPTKLVQTEKVDSGKFISEYKPIATQEYVKDQLLFVHKKKVERNQVYKHLKKLKKISAIEIGETYTAYEKNKNQKTVFYRTQDGEDLVKSLKRTFTEV